MATAMRVCRVCGKQYEACHTLQRTPGVFRWQEVACSPACGEVYLEQVTRARETVVPEKKKKVKKAYEPVEEIKAAPQLDEVKEEVPEIADTVMMPEAE